MFTVQTLKKLSKGLPAGRQGFTLIELMIVIAVIAILATIALFGLSGAQKTARDVQRQQIMNGLRASMERFNGDNGGYPNGSFTMMAYSLSTGGYFTTPAVDPGCTGAKVTYPTSAAASPGNYWAPCSGVTYTYTTDGKTYNFGLTRESGGTNNFGGPN